MINNGVDTSQWDKDGDGLADKTEKEIEPQLDPKYESVREAYQSKEGFLAGAGEVIRNTTAGKNTVGKVVGFGLDIATFIAPQGTKIDRLRARGKEALNLNKDRNDMKGILKRAFTMDGGGFIRVRDEDGKISPTAIGATAIRLLLVLGVYYGAKELGLSAADILTTIGFG